MPEGSPDSAAPKTTDLWPRWAKRWGAILSAPLLVALVAAFVAWLLPVLSGSPHPSHDPRVVVVEWHAYSEFFTGDTFTPAIVSVRVHNDGDASIEGCKIYWVEVDSDHSVSRQSKVLGYSDVFGLGPNEWYVEERQPAIVRRKQIGFVPGWSALLETSVYVQCAGNVRSVNNGSPQSVVTMIAF